MTVRPIPKAWVWLSKSASRTKAESAGRVYACATLLVALFTVAHVVSLPVEITFDGLGYIDMADMLGTDRFPQEWNALRTPLYPSALKISFWVLGRQPLAPIVLSSSMALIGILTLGAVVRRLAGDLPAALAMMGITLFPTLITYEHAVLTEAGTFCCFAVVCWLALWPAGDEGTRWTRAGLVALVFGAGYYWRQNILSLAPAIALLLVLQEWAATRTQGKVRLIRILGRAGLIVILPMLLSKPWGYYVDTRGLGGIMLRLGLIQQAVLPPEDAFVGENADAYMQAIRESIRDNNFYSGMTWDRVGNVCQQIFAKPTPQGTERFFLDVVRRYPGRYLSGFGRALLLFAGVSGVASDNRSYREEVLSLTVNGAKIGDGPQPLQSRIKEQFRQNTTPGVVMRVLRRLGPVYDRAVLLSSLMTLLGFAWAIWTRNLPLLIFCSLPLYYMVSYAVVLVSIDRFMVPVYPAMLANLVVVPASFWNAAHKARPSERP